MNASNNGGAAFPRASGPAQENVNTQAYDGMSLRDWFAGKSITCVEQRLGTFDAAVIAERCYDLADAMLKARAERKETE